MIESEKIFIKSVGEKLRETRLSKKLSQENLSLESDVPRNVIGRIERGEVKASIVTLFRICNALKVDIKELFS
ncbi:anaerobic benzoate catabolism transcriptional regulator [compost metagenome]